MYFAPQCFPEVPSCCPWKLEKLEKLPGKHHKYACIFLKFLQTGDSPFAVLGVVVLLKEYKVKTNHVRVGLKITSIQHISISNEIKECH